MSELSVFSKLFEKVLQRRICKFINKVNFFPENWFEFGTKGSTNDAVPEKLDTTRRGIVDKLTTNLIILSLKRALDSLDHMILLEKGPQLWLGVCSLEYSEVTFDKATAN